MAVEDPNPGQEPSGAPTGEPQGAPDPNTDPQGYQEYMINLAESQNGDPQGEPTGEPAEGEGEPSGNDDKPTRPDNVPEKFWNEEKGEVDVEALLKSNAELEKQFTKSRQNKEGEGEGDSEGEGEGAENKDKNEPLAAFTKALDTAAQQMNETGQIEDSTREELVKNGISEEVLDTHVRGLKAIQKLSIMEAHNAVGGEDNYKQMIDWAKGNLSDKERARFDADVLDEDARSGAIEGLWARYKLATGSEGGRATGNRSSEPGNSGYKSQAEMQRDMTDPRYDSDPAFRKQVMEKVRLSDPALLDVQQYESYR